MKRPAFEKHLAAHCERLQLMGFIAHEALQQRARAGRRADISEKLSERERECLLWLARGLRTREIADRLNLAAVTVDLHLKRIRTKLGAATREEALAKAILSGEIVP
jgi:DNA-binding CsgD family transcriptional regulator